MRNTPRYDPETGEWKYGGKRMMTKFENFERAFDCHVGSCSATCACGRVFYNPDRSWDFEENELEDLEKDPNATGLDYAVSFVEFEGQTNVMACDCWHNRAKQIMGFLDSHANKIAEYLKLEKERKTQEAENSPVV